jgi:hypothetical protein
MPTYLFQDKDTGDKFEQFLSISELDEFLENHPNLIQLVNGGPSVIGTMGKNTPIRKSKDNK